MKEFYIMITTKVFKHSKSIIFALKFHKRDKKTNKPVQVSNLSSATDTEIYQV